ncbi:MAG: Mrp/NBP35 family ATP-binding protein [Desulfuromonadaceae bacterium]|nr:Mrp/NBP35 family ATP-binding protein [Desulfuromonas sp.]MDY0184417.1 Mrp/NBP35 family ATP-binding protein [Desulfuromonadaceae bacterium]
MSNNSEKTQKDAQKNPCNGCDKSSNCSDAEKKSCDQQQRQEQMQSSLAKIKHKILVMSGKGGVGKSTTAVNLALSLAQQGATVGLLDIDLHGPSVPTMLGLELQRPAVEDDLMLPVGAHGLKVMSIGFLIKEQDDALIWRGPMKAGVIQQFLRDVNWGELDYLVVDCPPGTGDEALSIVQLLGENTGAVLVTTPQKVALVDVRKSVTFCHQLKLPIYGIVENMSGFACPHCNEMVDIFKKGGGREMAGEMNVPFLGQIPMDPRVVDAGDEGTPVVLTYPDSPTAKALTEIAAELALRCR